MEFKESNDGAWLRELAERCKKGELPPPSQGQALMAIADRLELCALGCDERALLKEKEVRALKLEKRVEERLSERLALWLSGDEPWEEHHAGLIAAIWLTGRQMKAAGVVQGLSGMLPMLLAGGKGPSRGKR